MKARAAGITAVLLIVSITNYFRLPSHHHVRTVEFLSVLVIGALSGILLTYLIGFIKNKIRKDA